MGIRARKLRADKRRARKRSIKEARRALYKSYAEQGRTKKRGQSKKTGPSPDKGCHKVADCGNPGCGRCYPGLVRRMGSINPKSKKVALA